MRIGIRKHYATACGVTECVCLVLGWFSAADRHRCRQCSRHQLVLRLWHCGCFHKVKGSQQQMSLEIVYLLGT